jgi:hypothetical protein
MAMIMIIDGTPRAVTLAHAPPFTMEEIAILTGQPEDTLRVFPIHHETYKFMIGNPVATESDGLNVKASEMFMMYADDETKSKVPVGHLFFGDVLLCDELEGEPA